MNIPKNAPLVYITVSAEINQVVTENLIATMTSCASSEVQTVYVLLSTPGGKVMNGLNLYNVLLGVPFDLVMHNVGCVNSIGNTIFLAGKKRYANPMATFMFHGVGFNVQQNQRFEEKQLLENLTRIRSEQKTIGQIISKHTSLSEKEIARFFREAQTKDAQFALDKGIIHEIKQAQITPGCPTISLIASKA
jgi:ATP-dependent protease ClpP protease subunit